MKPEQIYWKLVADAEMHNYQAVTYVKMLISKVHAEGDGLFNGLDEPVEERILIDSLEFELLMRKLETLHWRLYHRHSVAINQSLYPFNPPIKQLYVLVWTNTYYGRGRPILDEEAKERVLGAWQTVQELGLQKVRPVVDEDFLFFGELPLEALAREDIEVERTDMDLGNVFDDTKRFYGYCIRLVGAEYGESEDFPIFLAEFSKDIEPRFVDSWDSPYDCWWEIYGQHDECGAYIKD